MKLFFYLLFFGVGFNCYSQTFSPSVASPDPSVVNNLYLNKYLWSHAFPAKGSKSILDFDAIENWRSLERRKGSLAISCDGMYFAYVISYNWYKKWAIDSLVIQSTSGSWRKCIAGTLPGFFSADGKQYIFLKNDVLCFLKTNSETLYEVTGIVAYKKPPGNKPKFIAYELRNKSVILKNLLSGNEVLFKGVLNYNFEGNGNKFVCQLYGSTKELLVQDLINGTQKKYASIKDYKFDATGKAVLLMASSSNGIDLTYEGNAVGKKRVFFTNDTALIVGNYHFDRTGTQIVFNVKQNINNQAQNSIWYWRMGMDRAVEKIKNRSNGIPEGMLNGDASFTGNGRYIQFDIEKKEGIYNHDSDAVQLDVWNYKDTLIQSTQLVELTKHSIRSYRAFMNVNNDSIIEESDCERIVNDRDHIPGDFVIFRKRGKEQNGDRFWLNDYYVDSNWLVSLMDASRTSLPSTKGNSRLFRFSPSGNYLVYYDPRDGGNYFSYDCNSGKQVNISNGVPKGTLTNEWNEFWPIEDDRNTPFGIATWYEKYKVVWVYDKYDIWALDLTGKRTAVNITNGYGRSSFIIFRLSGDEFGAVESPTYSRGHIILKAYNVNDKSNGFYGIQSEKGNNPKKLFMASCVIEKVVTTIADDMIPVKAEDAEVWIVKKQSAEESPNYYLTTNFAAFKSLTDLQPQHKYNWLSSELHTYNKLAGSLSQGVLYKPENFDPLKKYPVVIAFYAVSSYLLNFFPAPELLKTPNYLQESPGWLVSHGYLVFVPDIDFSKGYWGPNTLNSLEGAARYLSNLPFVDSNHIGAVGHSNSGRYSYYLLTHSNKFAAMSIGSGHGGTDMISLSLSTNKAGYSELEWGEIGSFGNGLGDIWQNKDVWLDHMAILNADKVISPLLLFHNKNDGDDVRLAVELYTSLRRLGKKSWWLQYDDGGHGVYKLKDIRDFTLRCTQFFDHFLKEAPAPRWMTQGIPAKLKGVQSRYELDPSGTCSLSDKECPICKKWNEQYKRFPGMFKKPINEWSLSERTDKPSIEVN
ncbi:hypothetical protein A4H97_32020 [Niastella yeongjuensis]|uniref:Peptidase S9 prolyl oligopeptidase catalytic domain-containing protein n=2 Tax=Niastella yeongjuensis TaxID=354355 RepID=A0A1V9EII7_9BACT|nr:hypothetical protein A4H97_32020 [Niastella yeongjuensis]SEP46714.1 Dipeptidyl aminopeptidase/acylaminoacyl peptidase [Niastella yeongjuensis]